MVFGRRRRAVQASEKNLRGRAPDGGRVLSDDSDPRLEEIRQQDVVEADQRDALVQLELAERAKGADRHQVLAGEEGGRGTRATEHLQSRLFGLLDPSQVQPHQAFVELDPRSRQLFDITAMAL